jgi:hypothetical protein
VARSPTRSSSPSQKLLPPRSVIHHDVAFTSLAIRFISSAAAARSKWIKSGHRLIQHRRRTPPTPPCIRTSPAILVTYVDHVGFHAIRFRYFESASSPPSSQCISCRRGMLLDTRHVFDHIPQQRVPPLIAGDGGGAITRSAGAAASATIRNGAVPHGRGSGGWPVDPDDVEEDPTLPAVLELRVPRCHLLPVHRPMGISHLIRHQ